MNTILKRVISLLLCTVMTIGYMPVNAFAMESGETVTTETTEVTAEQTEAASEETEAPSESTESLAELSEVTDDSDEEEEETEKESEKEEEETEKESEKEETEAEKESEKEEKEAEKESEKEETEAEKESEKEEKEAEKESKKEEKKAEKEAKKEEKETEKETEPSTEPSTEATEPSTVEIVPEETVPETTEEGVALFDLERASAVKLNVPNSEDLAAELERVKKYVDYMMSQNDPETVVKTFKKHFTWDTELRENSKTYLYDWSYYNGVVFEGLEYLYEVTGESKYKDYVVEYMSSLINADGTWANCTNDGYTDKQAAGYNENHGVDTFKTASLLLDAYAMTNDSRYLTMAGTIAGHLENVAVTSDSIGGNYVHTWGDGGTPSYALWLDGLYMTLPFRAEYAEYAGDTAKLQDIVERLTWVSENMYDSDNGLFYHAANANNNSGTFWLRSIGWYAAALADVMDSVDSTQRAVLADQLTKLADGLKAHYNEGGMWLNKLTADYNSSTNPYETSGTALVSYALLKAVNNGWIDESYADMALTAFYTISVEKLNSANTTLTDICQKGAPTTSNSTFKDNEGKGVGPFIMLYAEVLEYTGVEPEQPEQPTEPSEPTEPADQEIKVEGTTEGETSVTMTVSGVSAPVEAAALTEEDKTLLEAHEGIETYVAIDVTGTLAEGEKATFTVAIPEGWDADRVVGISVEEGEVKEIPGTHADGKFTFTVDHFSAKGVGLTAKAAETTGNSGTGNLVGGKVYTLDTNGVTPNKNYLIVNTNNGAGYALTNNGSNTPGSTTVTISDGKITVPDDSKIAWVFSNASNGTVKNDTRYLYLDSSNILNTSSRTIFVENQNNGAYQLYKTNSTRYLRYYNGWGRTSTATNVYLYEYTSSSAGEAVTFTIEPASATIQPNGTVALTGTVTVADETVDLSNCTVTWASSDTSKATVSNGTVTGVADGTANITATLSAVNGTALQENIVLNIPVTVETKTIDKVEWVTSSGTVYQNDGPAVRTGGKILVTYSNGDTDTVNVTVGMLNANTQTIGTQSYTLVYNGVEVDGSFALTVVERPDANYPEYPDPGSVMVDKYIADSSDFQNTGVAEINLVAAGLPASVGVDVILVTDLSNSMAWTAKTRADASSHEGTKMYSLQKSVESFADIFLAADDDGARTQNTVSLVTFGGYDADYTNKVYTAYADPTQTLLLGSSSASAVKNTINNIRVLADDALNRGTSTTGYYLSFDGGNSWGENYGNTNYDHAFMETEAAIRALKEQYAENYGGTYDESGREIYILFMTDGAPSNYNGVYYNYKTGDRADVNCTWVNADGDEVTYTMGNNRTQYQEGPWYEYIAGGAYTNGQIPGNPLYWADQVDDIPGVADIFPIGFDLDNGGFSSMTFTENDGRPLDKVLEKLVTGKTLTVRSADSEDGLNSIYAALAADLKLAATKAYFVDQMGGYFNVQMASTVTKFAGDPAEKVITLDPRPQIKISTSTIYTPDDVNGTTITDDMVGDVIPGTEKTAEIVTFNDAGNAAYSDVDGYEITYIDAEGARRTVTVTAGTTNIMIDNVIYGRYFWYNNNRAPKTIVLADGSTYELPAETFYWNIGTINNVQFKMSYYVYLAGSAEGQAEEGTYATNNYAILYYKNWLDNDAEKHTDSPALAWKSASVHYGFYLVNDKGEPVTNRATGATGLFENAVKVTNKIFHDTVLLNTIENTAVIEVASTKVPEGYTVFDPGAVYKLTVDSNLEASGWTITNTVPPDTTYVTDYNGSEYTKVTSSNSLSEAEREGWSYTATTVWFAVLWEPSTVPDVVVIDYGLPVDIGVLENDMFGSAGKLTGIGELDDKPVTAVDQFITTHSDAFTVPENGYAATYGTAEMVEGKVRYTPKDMQMPTYDKFAYEAQYAHPSEGLQYYYGDVTVIPATTIYYEDSFVDTTSYTWDNTENNWGAFVPSDVNGDGETDNSLWSIAGTRNNSATQAEDRPGKYSLTDANNIYGYDSANLNMSTYSLGSALKAIVDYDNKAEASFEFYGTGFDVISMTSNTTGSIYVAVYDANNNRVGTKKMVDTYYGCKQIPGDANGDGTIADGEVVWVVDPESTDAIYQVPVMKVEGLTYGQYKAVIEVIWEPLYDNIEGSEDYEFYLDAIRIYDPANDGAADNDAVIENAYKADGEGWPSYIELRNKLISAASFDKIANDVLASELDMEGLVFIDGDDSVGNAQLADYVSYGPNNEVYLAPGQRVAFLLSNVNENVAGIHIGIKSADGQRGTYTITNIAKANKDVDGKTIQAGTYYGARTFTMDTTTDMYYDLTDWRNDIIVISNTGDRSENNTQGIISITNIKATYKQDPDGTTVAGVDDPNSGIMVTSLDEETAGNEVGVYMTPRAATLTLRALNASASEETPEESVPETTVPEETEPDDPEDPEVTEPEETQPDKEAEKIQKEIEKALEKAAKEAEKIAKEMQKAAKKAAKALSKLFGSWF